MDDELGRINDLQNSLRHFFRCNEPRWPTFILDLFNILLLSLVFYNFGVERYQVTYFFTYNERALQKIFSPSEALLGDLNLLQKDTGRFAVTDVRQITGFIDFILHTFDELDEHSLYYSKGPHDTTICLKGEPLVCHVIQSFKSFKSKEWLNIQAPFRSWKEAHIEFISLCFSVKAGIEVTEAPNFRINVFFDNSYHDGMLSLELKIGFEPPVTLNETTKDWRRHYGNLLIISMSLISLVLSLQKVFRGIQLGMLMRSVFLTHLASDLNLKEKIEFLDLGNIFRLLGCALKICGCLFIIYLRLFNVIDPKKWDTSAVLMSITYFYSILQLGSYMEGDKPSVILLTMKYSVPKFMRVLLPSFFVYCAFVLTAWIVIGPYHPKFKEIQVSSDSLFSLINGDDMFPTFSSLSELASPLIIVFFKIFLYSFIIIFMYLLLSITISIVSTTYEDISKRCEEDPDWRRKERLRQRLHLFYKEPNFDHYNFKKWIYTSKSSTVPYSLYDIL